MVHDGETDRAGRPVTTSGNDTSMAELLASCVGTATMVTLRPFSSIPLARFTPAVYKLYMCIMLFARTGAVTSTLITRLEGCHWLMQVFSRCVKYVHFRFRIEVLVQLFKWLLRLNTGRLSKSVVFV